MHSDSDSPASDPKLQPDNPKHLSRVYEDHDGDWVPAGRRDHLVILALGVLVLAADVVIIYFLYAWLTK